MRVEAAHWRSCATTTSCGCSAAPPSLPGRGRSSCGRGPSRRSAPASPARPRSTSPCAARWSRWSERALPDDQLLQIAMNVEAQAIDVPTGVQDYRPALYGGIVRRRAGRGRRPPRRRSTWIRGARAAARARVHRRVPQLGHQQLGDHQASHRRRPRQSATASGGSATSRSRCAPRSSRRLGRRRPPRSPPNGRTANSSRPA